MGSVFKWKTISVGLCPGKELDLARHCCRNYNTAASTWSFLKRGWSSQLYASPRCGAKGMRASYLQFRNSRGMAIRFISFDVNYFRPLERNYRNSGKKLCRFNEKYADMDIDNGHYNVVPLKRIRNNLKLFKYLSHPWTSIKRYQI